MENNRHSFEEDLARMRREVEDFMGAMCEIVRGAAQGGERAVTRMSEQPKRPPLHPRILADELGRMRAKLDDLLDRLSEQIPGAEDLPAPQPAAHTEEDFEKQFAENTVPPLPEAVPGPQEAPAPDPKTAALIQAAKGMEQAVAGLECAVDALLDADAAK